MLNIMQHWFTVMSKWLTPIVLAPAVMTERSIDYVRPVRVCQNKIKMKMSGTTLHTPH